MFQRNWCRVVVLAASVVYASGNDFKDDERSAHSDQGGLWFGPRLGKRSLQMPLEDHRDVYYRLMEAADALKRYYGELPVSYLGRRNEPETQVTKKVIFKPIQGRSLTEEQERQFDFTPRLGRNLELAVTPPDQAMFRGDGDDRPATRSRYFSPRLGRTMNFSPRLGRELVYDNYPEKVRVARSTNDTKTSKR